MEHGNQSRSDLIHMPAPTAWPMVLALGVSLLIAGMVTSVAVSLLGLVLMLFSAIGWFRSVLPVEAHEFVEAEAEPTTIPSLRTSIERLPIGPMHRKVIPVETFQFTTGLRGGVAGGIAMIVPATAFSLLRYHSLWYATNLMAAGGFVSWANQSDAFLAQFHWQGLLAALGIHITSSLLVGLLYGAMLPMFPRWPILTAGFIAPLLWTGLLSSVLGIVSPILNARIDWYWFVPSQIAYGLVAGYVVNLHTKVRTPQFQALPFAVRAGIHGANPELRDDTNDLGNPK
jgi:membrane-associated protease RseP (regulator of RpoE activity)